MGVRQQEDLTVPAAAGRPIRLGISACLLGQEVRFDGGHKNDPFLVNTFGRFVEWVPVCPEVEAGFGTPREAMRLVRRDDEVRLLTVKTARDVTTQLDGYARRRVVQLTSEELSGYVLKKDSPSCGMERVKLYDPKGTSTRSGRGLYAVRLRERFPDLPIEEEGRLSDPRLRENFIARVFAYWRLQALFGTRWTIGDLVRFHTAHKLILMAHSLPAYRSLGQLVADAKGRARKELEMRYRAAFMAALSTIATPRRHTNVLQHMAGYFKGQLDEASRRELQGAIEDYHRELVPLIVPITLVRHHVRTLGIAYLADQLYLEPHPKELMLRNHV